MVRERLATRTMKDLRNIISELYRSEAKARHDPTGSDPIAVDGMLLGAVETEDELPDVEQPAIYYVEETGEYVQAQPNQ